MAELSFPRTAARWVRNIPARRALGRRDPELAKRFGGLAALGHTELTVLAGVHGVLTRYAIPPGVVFDVGAFDGTWSEVFARCTGQPVYAFEPQPHMVAAIEARAARVPTIRVQPVACGAAAGETTMNVDNFGPSSSLLRMTDLHKAVWNQTGDTRPVTVRVVTLDEWCDENRLPQPVLIKMDVQGFEDRVLEGGRRVVRGAEFLWMEMNFHEFYEGGSTFHTAYTRATGLGFELIDCVDLVRGESGRLLYFDAIFRRART
jgi:FkbM family methyltransferase